MGLMVTLIMPILLNTKNHCMPNETSRNSRRSFLGRLAAGAAALGAASLSPLTMSAKKISGIHEVVNADNWIREIRGKHKMAFDVTQPHGVYPFAWPRVFLTTNQMTGADPKDVGAIVVLRHTAIPYAMEDRLWKKYSFGEVFKAEDPVQKVVAVRNPFWNPKEGDYKVPGIGNVAIGINELQQSGIKFCVCEMAINVQSAAIAQLLNESHETVKNDFLSGLLPGIIKVPSGVWALGRAQQHGFGYCFAG
jgi:intracellular sulfur oxidation DsrE/DsrF family protein